MEIVGKKKKKKNAHLENKKKGSHEVTRIEIGETTHVKKGI